MYRKVGQPQRQKYYAGCPTFKDGTAAVPRRCFNSYDTKYSYFHLQNSMEFHLTAASKLYRLPKYCNNSKLSDH